MLIQEPRPLGVLISHFPLKPNGDQPSDPANIELKHPEGFATIFIGNSLYSGLKKKPWVWEKKLLRGEIPDSHLCLHLQRLCIYSTRIYRVANSRCKSRCHASSWFDSWNISDSQPTSGCSKKANHPNPHGEMVACRKETQLFLQCPEFWGYPLFCVKSHSLFIAKLPVPSVSSVDVEGFMSGSYTNRMHSTRLKQEVRKKYKENFVESLCTCLQRIHNIYTSFPTPSTASVCRPLDPLGIEDWWLSSFWGNSYEQGLLGWGICPKNNWTTYQKHQLKNRWLDIHHRAKMTPLPCLGFWWSYGLLPSILWGVAPSTFTPEIYLNICAEFWWEGCMTAWSKKGVIK